MTASKKKKKPRASKLYPPGTVGRLYEAVTDYVEERGGKLVVIGGIEVQHWHEGNMNFRVAVRCTGRAPERTKEPRT